MDWSTTADKIKILCDAATKPVEGILSSGTVDLSTFTDALNTNVHDALNLSEVGYIASRAGDSA